MLRLAETGEEIGITRRGKLMGRLVPLPMPDDGTLDGAPSARNNSGS
jgi:antitoxin (DNA-binding transcriptional repressor) of toxin-antitoxin stability system